MTTYRQKLEHGSEQGQRKTDILIGAGVLDAVSAHLGDWLAGRTLFVVSTESLLELHGAALEPLRARSGRTIDLLVEDGEAAKQVEVAHRLWDEMLSAGGKRDSRLVTFGGGSVGDLGGFVAGCFLRGIEYCQIPTTLLAQVDAAIGGKTAVDLAGGKNTVGLFHHPVQVISDTVLLSTLPVGELRSGLVESVKMAALLDVGLFERIEANLDALLQGDVKALAPVVSASVAAKCRVVEADEKEGGLRKVLNFGHTLGHAIEGALDYEGLRHGEAVAYGLLFAVRLAERRGLAPEFGQRLSNLLRRFELPPLPFLDAARLWEFMTRDKKATEKGITWVLPISVGDEIFGHYRLTSGIARDEIMEELEGFLGASWE